MLRMKLFRYSDSANPRTANPRLFPCRYEPESDKWPVRQPPAALRQLRIAFVPRRVLLRPRRRSGVLERVPKRSTARDARVVRRRDPLGGVTEQVEQSERVGLAGADGMRGGAGVAAMPGDGLADGARRIIACGELCRARPLRFGR